MITWTSCACKHMHKCWFSISILEKIIFFKNFPLYNQNLKIAFLFHSWFFAISPWKITDKRKTDLAIFFFIPPHINRKVIYFAVNRNHMAIWRMSRRLDLCFIFLFFMVIQIPRDSGWKELQIECQDFFFFLWIKRTWFFSTTFLASLIKMMISFSGLHERVLVTMLRKWEKKWLMRLTNLLENIFINVIRLTGPTIYDIDWEC